MNFMGHLTGGVLVGSGVSILAMQQGWVGVNYHTLEKLLHQPLELGNSEIALIKLFGLTVFMSLFPDLDTQSIPQRWFFRGVFGLLLFFFWKQDFDAFATTAFCSILPVLHKHRGWTHWKVTPWVVAVLLASVQEYFATRSSWLRGFDWNTVWESLQRQWLLVVGIVVGHYTHLLLDSRHIRWLSFLSNDQDHH
jgi:hypothetical protein